MVKSATSRNGDRSKRGCDYSPHRTTPSPYRAGNDFNTSKCRVMHLGRANNKFEYTMGNDTLEVTNEEKDLGVITSSNLKPSKQCHQAYAKASRAHLV